MSDQPDHPALFVVAGIRIIGGENDLAAALCLELRVEAALVPDSTDVADKRVLAKSWRRIILRRGDGIAVGVQAWLEKTEQAPAEIDHVIPADPQFDAIASDDGDRGVHLVAYHVELAVVDGEK
ncbi:hypothetical protein Airi01_056360 [Actinoallomurus iriomotensis]|uniref:Uncharacterized protein n=1 Tax=Actinoallomurus iriomotensis TaxID=478107 RepID=A0A9W6RKV8_9ACTN|nr:hypothetical protein Airi01_056360 [Actinoallomurus iriomotensis]